MYRITLILLTLITSFNTYAKCFKAKDLVLHFDQVSKNKYSLHVHMKLVGNIYFCNPEEDGLKCLGDDDSGVFYSRENQLVLKSNLAFGYPDKEYIVKKDDYETFKAVSCPK